MPTPLFISYSHRDKDEKEQLCGHLQLLPEVDLDVWSDTMIRPGQPWEAEIEAALGRAKLAVLLITKDFLNSDFIRKKEIPEILLRHGEGSLVVVPIIARSCPWNLVTWLARLQALPEGGVPIWNDTSRRADDPLNQVAQQIHKLLSPTPPVVARPPIPPVGGDAPSPEKTGVPEVHVLPLPVLPQPKTRSTTGAEFRDVLSSARAKIDTVTYYKDLHDELQTIHTRCYRQMVDNTRWFPGDPSVKESFLSVQADLETSVLELQRIRAQAPAGVAAANWIDSIEGAARSLALANETDAADKLASATIGLRRVLNTVPGRLDSGLNAAARDINVTSLVRAFTTARESQLGDGQDSARITEFQRGLTDLAEIGREWDGLVAQHGGWEEVETTLRLIDESMRSSPVDNAGAHGIDELRASFDFITESVARLVPPDKTGALERLAAAHEKLSQALARYDAAGSRNQYVSFRSLAGRRFENLDKQLKDMCHRMVQVGDHLQGFFA